MVAILAHKGYSDQNSWLSFAIALAERGFTVLTFDFRSIGQSGGTLQASQLEQDVRAAVGFLQTRSYAHIICIGASFGSTACMTAALQTDIDGLVVIASLMSEGDPTEIEPEEFSLLTMPKLFINAEDDNNNLAAVATEMYALSPEPKELWIVPGSAHATDLFSYSGELRQVLLDFLEEVRTIIRGEN